MRPIFSDMEETSSSILLLMEKGGVPECMRVQSILVVILYVFLFYTDSLAKESGFPGTLNLQLEKRGAIG